MEQAGTSFMDGKYLFVNDLQGNVSKFFNYAKHSIEFGAQVNKTKLGC
jgi:hypothetical protein